MVDYEIFKGRFKEIAEFTLARPDKEINLDEFKCGSSCCIAGNLPLMNPEKYEYGEHRLLDTTTIVPILIKDPKINGVDLITELAGFEARDFNDKTRYGKWGTSIELALIELFGGNETEEWSDREVIENRLQIVMGCTSYQDFARQMDDNAGYV